MPAPDTLAFVAGGTVQAGGGVYLERAADRDLLEHCRRGTFTYILTSRQMGKSSLMIRTAERLAADGACPAIVDLTELGAHTTAEQWYKGFLFTIEDQLGLRTRAATWWDSHAELSIAHRFARYFREVVLAERTERVVVFVDEIDTTLRLDFTDDFFAAVRFLYQGRANEPELQRLSFVLIGVATPGDLIKDAARTPFNVGHRIDLTDFTPDEALPLSRHLPVAPSQARDLVGWILRWTGGHPYLTLRVVRSLGEMPPAAWSEAAVAERVSGLFFSAQGDNDSNLQFVRDMLTKKAFNREAVLRTYYDIRRGESVPDKELDQVSAWLKLSGVVCRRDGLLQVRNAIYEHVFQKQWARDHLALNVNWRRRLTRAALMLVVLTGLITGPLGAYAWYQRGEAETRRVDAEAQRAIAERQREEANAQRRKAEESLIERTAALTSVQSALDELTRLGSAAGAQISARIIAEREQAMKDITDRTAQLRQERDDARGRLNEAIKANEVLRVENGRLKSAEPAGKVAARPPVTVPSLVGSDITEAVRTVTDSGLMLGLVERSPASSYPELTVFRQTPKAGAVMPAGTAINLTVATRPEPTPQRGALPEPKTPEASYTAAVALERVIVYHDSTAGATDWSFEVFVDHTSVIKLPASVFRDGTTYQPKGAAGSAHAAVPAARVRVVGTRLKQPVPLSVEGSAAIPMTGAPGEAAVHVGAKSGDPKDGEFLFVLRITPAR